MAYDVFLCFSVVDQPIAGAILETLEKSGISCYFPPRDTTIGGDAERESLAAISTVKVTVFIYTDAANMDSVIAKQMDASSKSGAEPVTIRLSNSMPLGRLGFYMTIPYTVDAREGEPSDHFETLVALTKETIALVEKNRAKTPGRWKKAPENKKIFELPGIGCRRWYVSLLSIAFYVFASLILFMTYYTLTTSATLAPDLIAAITLTLLLVVPVLILGNLFGIRDRLPLFKKRRPLSTIAGLFLIEAIIFFLFDFIIGFFMGI